MLIIYSVRNLLVLICHAEGPRLIKVLGRKADERPVAFLCSVFKCLVNFNLELFIISAQY